MNVPSRNRAFPIAVLSLLVLNLFFTVSMMLSLTDQARDETRKLDVPHQPIYSNFARVTGTPEEVFINFGHSADLGPNVTADDIPILQTVTMNFHTASRFAAAMQATIERHENVFGKVNE